MSHQYNILRLCRITGNTARRIGNNDTSVHVQRNIIMEACDGFSNYFQITYY